MDTGEIAVKDMTSMTIIRPTYFKNSQGVEFWEGDILGNGYVEVLVEYREDIGAFVGWYTHMDKDHYHLLPDFDAENWRIVGNMHEDAWMMNQ